MSREGLCTSADGIDCDGISVSTAPSMHIILSTEMVLSSTKGLSFYTSDETQSVGNASSTGTPQAQGHQLSQRDRIGAVIGGVIDVNCLISTVIFILCRRHKRTGSLKRNCVGYIKAELDSRPLERSFVEIYRPKNVPELGGPIVNELCAENREKSPTEMGVERIVHEIGSMY
ncbi:hypothetical protein OCU04_011172 [Sclerotinia nivalis]|uniref:Uncharacterized protein n=1 Tax=Sclerotinia nivalis TaxID=352851 RepID=A0A9X0ABR4_9HELO|nr:hypothetical protein OCU04_011172 [Sclerotinia nivalis]